jgi:hypothetical protein
MSASVTYKHRDAIAPFLFVASASVDPRLRDYEFRRRKYELHRTTSILQGRDSPEAEFYRLRMCGLTPDDVRDLRISQPSVEQKKFLDYLAESKLAVSDDGETESLL